MKTELCKGWSRIYAACREWRFAVRPLPRPKIDDPRCRRGEGDGRPIGGHDKTRQLSIAITAGSGAGNLPEKLLAAIVGTRFAHAVRIPFVCPPWAARGAHAEGQTALLAKLAWTEESLGCEIRSSMGNDEIGVLDNGMSVRMHRSTPMQPMIIAVPTASSRIRPSARRTKRLGQNALDRLRQTIGGRKLPFAGH